MEVEFIRPIDADKLYLGKFVDNTTDYHRGWNDALDAATLAADTVEVYKAANQMNLKPCRMCVNARVDDDLRDDNDLSYISVGERSPNFRIMIGSGDWKPIRIMAEMFNGQVWDTVAIYNPKFCPNCGRELSEYKNDGRD